MLEALLTFPFDLSTLLGWGLETFCALWARLIGVSGSWVPDATFCTCAVVLDFGCFPFGAGDAAAFSFGPTNFNESNYRYGKENIYRSRKQGGSPWFQNQEEVTGVSVAPQKGLTFSKTFPKT